MRILNIPGLRKGDKRSQEARAKEAEAVKARMTAKPDPEFVAKVRTLQIRPDILPHMFRGTYIKSRSDLADLRARTGYIPFEPIGECTTMPKTNYSDTDDNWQSWMSETKEKVASRAGLDAKTLETEKKARKAYGSLRDKIKQREAAKA